MSRIRNTEFTFVHAFLPLPVPLRGDLFPSFNIPCLAVLVVRPGGFNSFSGMALGFSFIYIFGIFSTIDSSIF
jgi:hypothetical protein